MPPRRLLASPIDDTVMSSAWPRRANGGRVAVRLTAATFFGSIFIPCGICTPSWFSILPSDWPVNGEALALSPLPSRPTTRP
ncbi:hypothetical protein D3C72_1719130 [compost metagenome]